MAAADSPILDRRLVIVTGKGGTGKTSVAGALALAAARMGRRVLAIETGRDEHLPRILVGPGQKPVGYAGRELAPGLTVMRMDPYAALAEYLGLQLGLKGLVNRVLRNQAFRQLMDASPGWRELITLGKVWHLEQQVDQDGRRCFDLIVIDAPATGHGITFLDVPRVVASAVRAGPLRRNAAMVEEMLRDENATLLLPVALAEELPARETLELIERVRSGIGVAVDRVIVNAVLPRPFPASVPDLDERLARLPDALAIPGLPSTSTMADCVRHLRSRYELNHHYVEQIGSWTGLPTLSLLPFFAQGILGTAELSGLADAMLGESAAAAA